MDLLPVKRARGHIPRAPKVLPCSGSACSPSSLSARWLCCAALLPCVPAGMDEMRAGQWR